MRILYLGDGRGTSKHRLDALKRCGHDVHLIDPRAQFGNSVWAERWIWRAGSLGMESLVRRYVLKRLRPSGYDVCIVNHGELVGPSLVLALRSHARGILHFNLDNPFVSRDMRRWRLMRNAVPFYDVIATPRASTVEEGYRRGARYMTQFTQCADEVIHSAAPFNPADAEIYGSDVSFVGTWMPERGALIRRLLNAGVNVKIFGPNWQKAPDYSTIAPSIAMSNSLGDEQYPKAIQYAKIALGFLSAENLDQHTSRSVEIPAIGTLLCAKRTGDHLAMYRENVEAIFWDNVEECAIKCLQLLANPGQLLRIAESGAIRQKQSGNWNEQLMDRLIDATLIQAAKRRAS